MLSIEVVFAGPGRQEIIALEVDDGTTIAEAVSLSGIVYKFPEYDFENLQKGIWNKVADENQVLADGDRIEIYRPLEADPKEARRRRASKVST